MSIRIPPSLKWLINKRARLLQAIELAEKQHSTREYMRNQMIAVHRRQEKLSETNLNASSTYVEALKKDLNAVDITLSLHEVPINPAYIAPIKTQTSARKFNYGAITRLIFSCLKYVKDDSRTTTEIAAFVAEYYKVDIDKAEFLQIRTSVKYRLRHLGEMGKVKRVNKISSNVEAHWQLSEWVSLDSQIFHNNIVRYSLTGSGNDEGVAHGKCAIQQCLGCYCRLASRICKSTNPG